MQFFGLLAEPKYPYKFHIIPSMSLNLLDLGLISHTQRGIHPPEINLKSDFWNKHSFYVSQDNEVPPKCLIVADFFSYYRAGMLVLLTASGYITALQKVGKPVRRLDGPFVSNTPIFLESKN